MWVGGASADGMKTTQHGTDASGKKQGKQVNKTTATRVRIKKVSAYGDPCNERVTG
jgi:hypothetical protein